jgi:hypothetical protein
MADTDPQDQDHDEPSELRKAADRGRAAQAEAEALKRELAFAKAGIDTDSKAGKMLLKSYEGELTPEAIKAEAEEIGLFKPQTAVASTETATPEEREQTDIRTGLATAPAVTGGTVDEDPQQAGLRAGFEARKQGASHVDAFTAALGPVFQAALENDPGYRRR